MNNFNKDVCISVRLTKEQHEKLCIICPGNLSQAIRQAVNNYSELVN